MERWKVKKSKRENNVNQVKQIARGILCMILKFSCVFNYEMSNSLW